MNLLNEKELTEALLSMPPGKQQFHATGQTMKSVASRFINIDFNQTDMNQFTVYKSDKVKMNAKREIELACATCDEANVLNYDIKYVRVIVSMFNRQHGAKVVARQVGSGVILVGDVSARPWLRQSDYEAIKLDMEAKLAEIRRKVRPDEFFDMLKPDFKNLLALDTLNEAVHEDDEDDEDDHSHRAFDPKIFVTKKEFVHVEEQTEGFPRTCEECGDGFTTKAIAQVICNACLHDNIV